MVQPRTSERDGVVTAHSIGEGDSQAAGVIERALQGPKFVALTLFAALLHATWNAVAHAVADRLLGFALMGLAWTIVCGAAVLVLGLPPSHAWPLIIASAGVHVAYNLLLLASYQLGDFGQMYPIARGTSPWVVAVITLLLGQTISTWQLVGVIVVSAGLIGLGLSAGRATRNRASALGAAVATGLAIAAYTVIDARGVRTTPVLVYAAWMFLLQGPVLPLLARARRGPAIRRIPLTKAATGIAGGLIALTAYGLVLLAQRSGATAAIAALRETSIVFGALIGTFVLHEHMGRARVAAAGVVTLGIAITAVR